jgi:hypothetical protein
MVLQTVKSGMSVIIASCSHKTFYAEYGYNGYKPGVKKAIIKWAADGDENTGDGAGIRCNHRYRYKRIKKRRTNRLCEQRVEVIHKV